MATYPNVNDANRYARDVVAGEILACRYVKLACQRHLNDLERAKDQRWPYRFDRDKAERFCRFSQKMPHTSGEWARKKLRLTLEDWQKFCFCVSFGWVRKSDGLRRFQEIYIEVPRKNGKSLIAASVGSQSVLLDYSRAEVNEMQILKQADVVMLLYMLPWRFDNATAAANLDYYEPRTIHDSSLSKAIHGIVAARCGRRDEAYRFWRAGCEIDLGDAPHSSDDGIHAAATGAIWLGAVQGFAGISVKAGELHVTPSLPRAWRRLAFPFCWQGQQLHFEITQASLTVRSDRAVRLLVNNTAVEIEGEWTFSLSADERREAK